MVLVRLFCFLSPSRPISAYILIFKTFIFICNKSFALQIPDDTCTHQKREKAVRFPEKVVDVCTRTMRCCHSLLRLTATFSAKHLQGD